MPRLDVDGVATCRVSPQLRDLVAFAPSLAVSLEILINASLPSRGELFSWNQNGDVIISPL